MVGSHLLGMAFVQWVKSFFTCLFSLPASPTHLLDIWGISLGQNFGDQVLRERGEKGRPRTRWMDKVEKWLKNLGVSRWKSIASIRSGWCKPVLFKVSNSRPSIQS
ncbi:hypothetical protein TNCV_4333511 [Trichonephila clavipes]|nr:hypothetical protein TNCV_4333511 [Trichonephila clavipes]